MCNKKTKTPFRGFSIWRPAVEKCKRWRNSNTIAYVSAIAYKLYSRSHLFDYTLKSCPRPCSLSGTQKPPCGGFARQLFLIIIEALYSHPEYSRLKDICQL